MANQKNLAIQTWNKGQKKLQSIILDPEKLEETRVLFLVQHELVHPGAMTDSKEKTFEDELWGSMTETDFRRVPEKSIYSIAWHLWHSARIEDITTSFLIDKKPQVFESLKFNKRLLVRFRDTGNSLELEDMCILSESLPMDELKEYRICVGKKTREAVTALSHEALSAKVSRVAIEEIRMSGAVAPGSEWLLDFWGKKTIAGIVLMPLSRHLMVHINEAKRLVRKRWR
jgi:hypothetical protein